MSQLRIDHTTVMLELLPGMRGQKLTKAEWARRLRQLADRYDVEAKRECSQVPGDACDRQAFNDSGQ